VLLAEVCRTDPSARQRIQSLFDNVPFDPHMKTDFSDSAKGASALLASV
jgi:hypothetical protein